MQYRLEQFLILIIACFLLVSCNSKGTKDALESVTDVNDTTLPKEPELPYSLDYPAISYQLVKLSKSGELSNILNKYKDDQSLDSMYRKILRTLNRKDLSAIRTGESIIVPDSVIKDERAYAIFPDEYIGARDLPKVIIIDNQYQCYACYEYGKIVRFAAANTGKERTPTFPGRYSLVWKQRLRLSSLDSSWKMPFTFNFHQYAGNAMHQFAMPGRPVSHSCIRQFMDDAEWIFKWGDKAKYNDSGFAIPHSGTPVIIINTFDYTRKKGGPWLELKSNKDYYVELPANPMDVEEALIPWCQIPKSSRGAIPNKKRFLYAENTLRARGIIRPGVVLTETVDFNKVKREKAKAAAKLAEEAQKNQEQKIEIIEYP